VPGIAERREFEDERNGTVVLFAGLNGHDGDVAGWVTDSTCSDNFVTFLWDLIDQTPELAGRTWPAGSWKGARRCTAASSSRLYRGGGDRVLVARECAVPSRVPQGSSVSRFCSAFG
jgi:hypothetical protein